MWFRVDDELHDHGKSRKAGKAAMGVWVLAGSWSSDKGTDGFVPEDVLPRWGNRTDAGRLVAAGFWYVDQQDGERGWRFHDWAHFQPSAETVAAWRAAESEAGLRGNHKRWHEKRGVTDPNCHYCYRVPDQVPDGDPDRVDVGSPIGSSVGSASPVPIPDIDTSPNGEVSRPESRDDVERICQHLALRITENGSKRPTITKGWRDAARLMLDRDGRAEAQVVAAIDWCQADDFWRANILSLPKLRERYDQLRLQAEREQRPSNLASHMTLVQQLAAEEAGEPTLPQLGGAS